jgi:hypothetical protein
VVESATSLEPMLTAMATALDAHRRQAALEEERDRVVTVLDRVEGIGHQDDDNFGPLVTVKLKGAELKAAVLAATDPEQARSLASRVQPFADLLTMLESTEVLDDQKFSSLEESVARAFGRQITVAVARRRLLLPGQPRTPQPRRTTPGPTAPEPEPAELEAEPAELEAESAELEAESAELEAEPAGLELQRAAPEPVRIADAMHVPEPVRTPEPEPIVRAATAQPPLETIGRRPPPTYEAPSEPAPEREPVVAAAPVAQQTAAALTDGSGTDQTAQWWLAAWARWSGWKSTLGFPQATREELAKYPYLLSVPIQESPEFEEGLLAYGYSIILEHVEKQSPGCIGNALNSLTTGQMKPVGTQLYEYLVSQGRLTETYADFVTNVLRAAVPEPGPWVQARMIHSKDDTRIFQRPTPRLGETEQTAQRFLADNQRFKEHAFPGTLEPLTTRFFLIQAELKDAHGVEARLTVDGAPSDAGLVAAVPAPSKATKMDVRRFVADGTPVPGIGRDYSAIWFAVFNADPVRKTDFRLGLTLRKDTRGMRK